MSIAAFYGVVYDIVRRDTGHVFWDPVPAMPDYAVFAPVPLCLSDVLAAITYGDVTSAVALEDSLYTMLINCICYHGSNDASGYSLTAFTLLWALPSVFATYGLPFRRQFLRQPSTASPPAACAAVAAAAWLTLQQLGLEVPIKYANATNTAFSCDLSAALPPRFPAECAVAAESPSDLMHAVAAGISWQEFVDRLDFISACLVGQVRATALPTDTTSVAAVLALRYLTIPAAQKSAVARIASRVPCASGDFDVVHASISFPVAGSPGRDALLHDISRAMSADVYRVLSVPALDDPQFEADLLSGHAIRYLSWIRYAAQRNHIHVASPAEVPALLRSFVEQIVDAILQRHGPGSDISKKAISVRGRLFGGQL